ncbi:hypothetical protein Agub_g15543, partial [Astrephomene gubernaculifera]
AAAGVLPPADLPPRLEALAAARRAVRGWLEVAPLLAGRGALLRGPPRELEEHLFAAWRGKRDVKRFVAAAADVLRLLVGWGVHPRPQLLGRQLAALRWLEARWRPAELVTWPGGGGGE